MVRFSLAKLGRMGDDGINKSDKYYHVLDKLARNASFKCYKSLTFAISKNI